MTWSRKIAEKIQQTQKLRAEGLTIEKIAEILDVSPATVQKRLKKKIDELPLPLRERRSMEGYCHRCGKELTDGFAYCPECRKFHREYMSARRARLKEIGICINCLRREARPGKTM